MPNANTTDLPACASPAGAHPPIALTADAGAQTGRPVIDVEIDWPLSERIPTVARVTFSDGTVASYTTYLDTGVCDGMAGTCTLPYCSAPWPEHTTVEQDDLAERAVVVAYHSAMGLL